MRVAVDVATRITCDDPYGGSISPELTVGSSILRSWVRVRLGPSVVELTTILAGQEHLLVTDRLRREGGRYELSIRLDHSCPARPPGLIKPAGATPVGATPV